jgi:predicted ATPase
MTSRKSAVAESAVLQALVTWTGSCWPASRAYSRDVKRYRLLETLHQYGRERLLAGDEAEGLHARHAAYYRALAEEADRALFGPRQVDWGDRLDAEYMNIHQALRWALEFQDC